MNTKHEYIVWIEPDEYDAFLQYLGQHGFHWNSGALAGSKESIIERVHDAMYATTYSLDLWKKNVSYFPLEIYQPSSPTHDSKKYDHYRSQCVTPSKIMEILDQEECK